MESRLSYTQTTGSGTRRRAFQSYRSHLMRAARNSPQTFAVPSLHKTTCQRSSILLQDSLSMTCLSTGSSAPMRTEPFFRKISTNCRSGKRTGPCTLYADKCKVIWITNKRNPLTSKYYIHDTELQTVKDAKYLGVTVSPDHGINTWKTQSKRPQQA